MKDEGTLAGLIVFVIQLVVGAGLLLADKALGDDRPEVETLEDGHVAAWLVAYDGSEVPGKPWLALSSFYPSRPDSMHLSFEDTKELVIWLLHQDYEFKEAIREVVRTEKVFARKPEDYRNPPDADDGDVGEPIP